jgi:hypothetical protein
MPHPAGIWRDRVVFTWDYRTFNFRDNILKAASTLLPRTPVSGVTLIDPPPSIERPYNDLSFIQCHIKFDTDKVGASALCNIIHTPVGYRIWTLNTVIESLHGFPEIPERDGHMTGPHSWPAQRAMDNEMAEHEPEVLIIGGGQKYVVLEESTESSADSPQRPHDRSSTQGPRGHRTHYRAKPKDWR